MSKNIEDFKNYLKDLEKFELPEYKKLPEVPLYREQVINYLQEILQDFSFDDDNPIITSFMINNYVKTNMISRPIDKKYDKDQIGYLLAITLLKQVTSLKDISNLIELDNTYSKDKQKLYEFYKSILEENIKNEVKKTRMKVETISKNTKKNKDSKSLDLKDDGNLAYVALRLYVQAQVEKMLADKIMTLIEKDIIIAKNLKNTKELNKIKKAIDKKEAKNNK